MKIAVYSLTYWYTEAEAASKKAELETWYASISHSIKPNFVWLVSGTYSDPAHSPVPYIPLINTGIEKTHGNDFLYWSYANLAHTHGIYNALLNTNCDICAQISTDSVINIDLRPILEEFFERPELVMAPAWNRWIEDAAIFYKRSGMLKYISSRKRPILVKPDTIPAPLKTEEEALEIFDGLWWNPWPEYPLMRQEHGYAQRYPDSFTMFPSEEVIAKKWPIVIRPAPDIIERAKTLWQGF